MAGKFRFIPPFVFGGIMKRISALILALVVLVSAALCSCVQVIPVEDPEGLDEVRDSMKYIIHAAGTLWGVDLEGNRRTYDGSNSGEGLAQCVAAGARVIEIDFNFTSDGELACIHDWYKYYAPEITDGVPLTLEEFENVRIFRNFTPLSIYDIVDFLRENEDVYIVTDIKDDNIRGLEKIAEICPDLRNRFIVQIYSETEYDPVRELGFDYIVYTLYRLDWAGKTDWRHLGEFEKAHPLVGYTFDYTLIDDCPGYLEGMLSIDVPLYIHTINGTDEQEKYFRRGISGIYTDDVVAD